MCRAERLDALGRNGNAVQELILLEHVSDLDEALQPLTDRLTESVVQIALDDKDDLVESGADRVVDRKINDKVAGAADGVDLLETFIPRAHTGGQHNKCHSSSDPVIYIIQPRAAAFNAKCTDIFSKNYTCVHEKRSGMPDL